MISVVIATLNDEARLARALEPLIPAAISGLVREVIVCDGGSTDATLAVADDAGARILESGADRQARIQTGCEAAKGSWLLLLDPGAWLEPAWQEAAEAHIRMFPDAAAYFPSAGAGWLGRFRRTQSDALLVAVARRDRIASWPRGIAARRLPARVFPGQP